MSERRQLVSIIYESGSLGESAGELGQLDEQLVEHRGELPDLFQSCGGAW